MKGRGRNVLFILVELGFKFVVCFVEGVMVERFLGSNCLRKIRDVFKEIVYGVYK